MKKRRPPSRRRSRSIASGSSKQHRTSMGTKRSDASTGQDQTLLAGEGGWTESRRRIIIRGAEGANAPREQNYGQGWRGGKKCIQYIIVSMNASSKAPRSTYPNTRCTFKGQWLSGKECRADNASHQIFPSSDQVLLWCSTPPVSGCSSMCC